VAADVIPMYMGCNGNYGLVGESLYLLLNIFHTQACVNE